MKKFFLPLVLFLISITSFAQDENKGGAYNAGEFIGKYILLPVIVLVIIIWVVRRNKKPKQ